MNSTSRNILVVSLGIAGGFSVHKMIKLTPHRRSLDKQKVHCEPITDMSELKMIGAQIFFRHGARVPLRHARGIEETTYDKEVWLKRHEKTEIPLTVVTFDGKPRPPSAIEERYSKVSFPGGMGAGMLTNLGRDQCFELGRRIRNKYIVKHKLISDEYETKNILTRSTNVNRCVESLQSVVAGMYNRNKIKEILKVQLMPTEQEILFPNFGMCPTLRQLEKMVPGFMKSQEGYRFVAHYIKYFTGDETDRYIDLMNYRDHFVARKTHGLEVPLWLEAVNKPLQTEAAKVISAYAAGTKDDRSVVMQLAVGPVFHLLEQVFDRIIRKEKGCQKLHLYSGHDTTLVPILVGIGAWEDVWPPYCSDVAFELYQNRKGQYFVKAVYNGKDVIFPGFEEPIVSYDDFKNVLAPYTTTPMQYNERCHNIELARETAEFWEAMKASKEEEVEEYPSNI